MPTSLPQNVREAWGEEVATDLARYIEQVVQEQGVPRDERPDREGGSTLGVYREVLSRLDVLENEIEVRFGEVNERLDRTDERLNQMDERLDQMNVHIGERFDAMNAQMNERFDAMNAQMDERFEAMNAQINERFEVRDERLDERFDQMSDQLDRMNDRILSMTRWLIGLLVAFGTMVTVLMAIAQFGT
jgi:flagellar capping protein FliD